MYVYEPDLCTNLHFHSHFGLEVLAGLLISSTDNLLSNIQITACHKSVFKINNQKKSVRPIVLHYSVYVFHMWPLIYVCIYVHNYMHI